MILHLVRCGVDLEQVGLDLRQRVPLSLFRLRQHVYDSFYLLENASIAVVVISQQDLRRVGCEIDDTKNLINLIMGLATAKMAIMIVQKECGSWKVSLRGKANVDVSKIAKSLGGGGHKRAAGFDIKEFDSEQIIEKIIKEYRK
ncbi:MAG: hypothetical protein CR967_02295 [Proteobacteria bacterium]|nr:MAG: hypothetical protein CR967_02295 [Pseudomonadota bacterium]